MTEKNEILGLRHLTGLPKEDDRRIKVLWFEDLRAIGISAHLEDFVQLTRAWIPEAAEKLLLAERDRVSQAMHLPVYRLPQCPHDVYIADHVLDEAPIEIFGEPTPARQAKAAGLTASVMMALGFPSHPATVIPYTAQEEVVRQQRDLIKRFCPHYVNIRWDDRFSKVRSAVHEILIEALVAHREYLPQAAAQGYLHLRNEERERLRKEIEGLVGSSGELGYIRISFETNWGARDLLLGGLWPEFVLAMDSLSQGDCERVIAWLERFCVSSLDEQVAQQFARAYFWMSVSARSEVRYRLAHGLRVGVDGKDLEIESLARKIGLSVERVVECGELMAKIRSTERKIDGIRAGRRQDIGGRELEALVKSLSEHRERADTLSSSIHLPHGWRVRHMLNAMKGFGEHTKRLAVLYLLLHEEARRWAFRDALLDDMPGLKTLVQSWYQAYKRTIPDLSGESIILKIAEIVHQVEGDTAREGDGNEVTETREIEEGLIACGIPQGEVEDLFEVLGHPATVVMMTPLTVDWVPRLLDPIPEQLEAADSDVAAGRVGVALRRIGFSDIGALLAPGGGYITRVERESLWRFAMDLGFPRSKWPAWIR